MLVCKLQQLPALGYRDCSSSGVVVNRDGIAKLRPAATAGQQGTISVSGSPASAGRQKRAPSRLTMGQLAQRCASFCRTLARLRAGSSFTVLGPFLTISAAELAWDRQAVPT
jgi:hypothetical protein